MGERHVAGSLDELLEGATSREPVKTADSKSGATFERVVIDDEPHLVKVVDGRHDWLAIASRDTTARAVDLWERGGYDAVPACIDHTVVGAARLGSAGAPWPVALLMRDVTDSLVAEDSAVDLATHTAFLDAMAELAVTFEPSSVPTNYMPIEVNYVFLSPAEAARQTASGTAGGPQPFVQPGWDAIQAESPELWSAVQPLLEDPGPLAVALQRGPKGFLHGDWKMGNLGHHPDGRVVLLDWDRPAVGPPTVDLAWYVAVNCDRLPESKDETVARFRDSVERHGLPTDGWWDEQLPLAMLGAFLMLGWSKAGQPDELAWWEPLVTAGLRRL